VAPFVRTCCTRIRVIEVVLFVLAILNLMWQQIHCMNFNFMLSQTWKITFLFVVHKNSKTVCYTN